MWTTPQRGVVLAIALAVFAYLSVRLISQHTYVGDPEPLDGARARELADRLDPNTAAVAELAAIPNVGDKLAAAIVEYRDRFISRNPGRMAFNVPTDLAHVRGIGAAKVESLRAYLIFPETPPATRP